MENIIEAVPAQYILWTLIVLIAIIVLALSVWKKAVSGFESVRQTMNAHDDRVEQLKQNASELKELKQYLEKHVPWIEETAETQGRCIAQFQEENEIIMSCLLKIIQVLQDVKPGSKVAPEIVEAERDILAFLNRTLHRQQAGSKDNKGGRGHD